MNSIHKKALLGVEDLAVGLALALTNLAGLALGVSEGRGTTGAAGSERLGLSLSTRSRREDLTAAKRNGVRVELDEDGGVAERVLLDRGTLGGCLGGAHSRLDLVGVDEAAQVRVGHGVVGQVEVLLGRGARPGAVKLVELLEGTLRPDDKAAHVATGRQLEQVEAGHAARLDTGQVAECLGDAVVLVVHDEGAAAEHVATVAHLSLAATELLGVLGVLDVSVGVHTLEDLSGLLGARDRLNAVGDDQRNLGDLVDAVATRHDERGQSRRSQSGDSRETALALVHLTVPLAPDLGRREHATTTAHVAEGSLARTVGTTASDTGNTRNSTAGAP
mmetsp:Transcript_158344/g.485145  ORF Transcript_158344/g.485145 Transcript_158344/m.485145 type:complete len:333 (+) Transcript_158344:3-1001(+)